MSDLSLFDEQNSCKCSECFHFEISLDLSKTRCWKVLEGNLNEENFRKTESLNSFCKHFKHYASVLDSKTV